MTDLLTHVLVAFALFTVASWRFGFDSRYVSIGVVGTLLPDLSKIHLLVPATAVENALGIPFSWYPLHRIGGAVVVCTIAATFFRSDMRARATGFLLAGTVLHFLLDAGIKRANGVTPPYFYPFSWYQPPAGNLYLSSDVWPAVVALALAATVWLLDRYRSRSSR